MMKLWSRYHISHSVDDALHLLDQYGGQAQVLAGGTDLLLDIQQGNHAPVEAMIDISKIPELTTVVIQDSAVTLGAGVTHSTITAHPDLRRGATCLVESCGVVGGPQVRNVATIGGNVAHALPAADGTLSLVALRAQAEVAAAHGRTWYDIRDLFLGPGTSRVDPRHELITCFKFELAAPGEGSAFKRIMRPQGVALPILGCAVWIKLDADYRNFADASVCLGPVAPTPARATSVEAALIGQPVHEETIAAAAVVARQALAPRTSKYRATAEYRTEMVELLVRQSLELALIRARTGEAVPEGVGM